MRTLIRLWKEDDGQDLTEYALLLVFVVLICVSSITALGTALSTAFAKAGANLSGT